MGTYNLPRNVKGENRILFIFTTKSLIYSVVAAGVGLLFYFILKMFNLTMVGIIIVALFSLIGFGIGTLKVPEIAKFEFSKKTGGEAVDDVIKRAILFKTKGKKIYVYKEGKMMNSINMITMILTVILGIMVMLLLVLGILYIKSKGKKKDDKNDEIIAGTGNKKGKGTKSYSTESVFDFMEFDKIEDNMIITQNGIKYIMVVECQGVNYDLMSEVEKNSVEEGFIQFLNTLRHPVQIYTQTRTINLENSIQTYRAKVQEIEAELEKEKRKYQQMVNSDNYSEDELKAAFLN